MRRVLVLCAAATLCGCSLLQSVANVREPSLSFKDAALSDVSLAGATVNLTFAVQNPNSVGISVAETDYRISVAGKQLVAGKPPAGLHIAADSTSDVTLPAQVRFADLGDSIAAVLRQNQVPYKAEGHIGVSTPLGVLPLGFSKEGTLPLPQVPAVTVQSPRIASLSLTQATVDLPLTLSNPNSFPLPLGSIAGNLSIAGAPVGRIASADLGRIDARQSRTVALPVTIHFAQAFAAAQALREGKALVALDGQLSSGGASVPVHIEREVDFTR
ncbi:MAG TPA: LEA type 2 family protein [Myxococcales bacterium]|jgi:LEA14-like dessication related protein|nr:LEA type 2 family protein [Myxococcales bacterium]